MNGEVLSKGQSELHDQLAKAKEAIAGHLSDPGLVKYLELRQQMRVAQELYAKSPTEENKNRYTSLFSRAQALGVPGAVIQEYDRLVSLRESLDIEITSYQ